MKLLVCAGYSRSLLNFRWKLIERFAECGYEVLGTAPENDVEVAARFERHGFRYVPLAFARSGANILNDIKYYRALRSLMLKERPEVVFCYTIKPVIFGVLAAGAVRVPKVYAMMTGLGYVFTGEGGFSQRFIRAGVIFLLKRSFRRCDGLFLQNPDDEAELRRRSLIPGKLRVHQVAGSGIDLHLSIMLRPAGFNRGISGLNNSQG